MGLVKSVVSIVRVHLNVEHFARVVRCDPNRVHLGETGTLGLFFPLGGASIKGAVGRLLL